MAIWRMRAMRRSIPGYGTLTLFLGSAGVNVGGSGTAGINQELNVAFGTADRALDHAVNRPAARPEPGDDAAADLAVERRIADHSALADPVGADLELGLDEGHEPPPGLGERKRRRQHRFEADEA